MIITLISLIIFFFSLEIYGSRRIAFILSLIFNVCSFIWPYNTSMYPQPLQALLMIAPAFFIYKSLHLYPSFICNYFRPRNKNNDNNNRKRKAVIFATVGGILLGLSVFAHPSSTIVIPGFVAYSVISTLRQSKKTLIAFLVSLATGTSFYGANQLLEIRVFYGVWLLRVRINKCSRWLGGITRPMGKSRVWNTVLFSCGNFVSICPKKYVQ